MLSNEHSTEAGTLDEAVARMHTLAEAQLDNVGPPADNGTAVATTVAPVKPQQPIPDTVDPVLVHILSTKRAHQTESEKDFVEVWLTSAIRNLGYAPLRKEDNVIVVVPAEGKDGMPSTLFSCHTDTCHHTAGRQRIVYDPNFGHIMLDKGENECLGADDGVGLWIMLKMIEAKVPGVYVFHRGEERGCVGSRALANKHKDWLEEFSAAIAFDRPNDYEVITHQCGRQRCASDEFGKALAAQLNTLSEGKLEYAISDRGVVTDTAQYRYIIPECINLGVGYTMQHTANETLDYAHAACLLEALLKVDWEKLPIVRKPERPAYDVPRYGNNGFGGVGRGYGYGSRGGQGDFGFGGVFREEDDEEGFGIRRPSAGSKPGSKSSKKPGKSKPRVLPRKPAANDDLELSIRAELAQLTRVEIADLIDQINDPEEIALWFVELIAEYEGLEHRLNALRRMVKNSV